jgi:hypothetical protein
MVCSAHSPRCCRCKMQTNPEITNGLTFEVKSWVQHVVDVNVIWNVSNMQFKDSNGSTFEMPSMLKILFNLWAGQVNIEDGRGCVPEDSYYIKRCILLHWY